ncbi:MAG: hypothetical protein KKD17_00080 [Nanoarchaeota archaeon]|nr:hypothetical protein [Nanoarchaeota archaeon]
MPKKSSIDEEVRSTAYHSLRDNSFMGKLEPCHLFDEPSVTGFAAHPGWREGVIDLFTRDIPTGKNKVKPTGWEDIPREFWPVGVDIDSYGNDGRAPSYHKHTHKGPVTFLDVFNERYEHMSPGERRKFIRRFADKDHPLSLLEGRPVTDIDPYALDILTEELISINPKRTPYKQSHKHKIEFAGFCLATVLTLGIIYVGMTDDSPRRARTTHPVPAVPAQAASQPAPQPPSPEPKPPDSQSPIELALADIPADILQTNPALIECQGETYQQMSKRLSGSTRYANMIKEYNKTHIPSFDYHSNRCENGKLLLFPPRMIDELTREPAKNYRRHKGPR